MDRETLFQYIEEYLKYQAQQRLENEDDCLYNDIETIIEEDTIPELKRDLTEYLGKDRWFIIGEEHDVTDYEENLDWEGKEKAEDIREWMQTCYEV